MKTKTSIILGTAIALVLGLTLDMIRNDAGGGASAAAQEGRVATFVEPRLDGVNLDVRLMGHMRPDPAGTAERFCRDMGYTAVADLVIRASATTRTIADGAVHSEPGVVKQAFAFIRCQSHHGNVVATG